MAIPHAINGPIPGENYTSDVRNYPWHRPPDVTKIDDAIDLAGQQLLDEDNLPSLITMLQTGIDIATMTDIFLTTGIGAGKWSVDLALILAGPISHMLYIICQGYGIKPNLGIDKKRPLESKSYIDAIKVDKDKYDSVQKALEDPKTLQAMQEEEQKISGGIGGSTGGSGGFMGMAQQLQQSAPSLQGDYPVTDPQGVASARNNGGQ